MVPPCSDRIARVPPYSRIIHRVTRTGLSPTKARRSKRFRLSLDYHWPGPRSLATTSGVSVDVLSSGYLDVSVPRVCFKPLCIQSLIPPCVIPENPNSHSSRRGCFVGIRSDKKCELKVSEIEGGFPHSEIYGSKPVRSSP